MKNKPNYVAIIVFYILAIALRYISNKTALLSTVPNEIIRIVLQGAGPAIGAGIAMLIFKIKPVLSLKGNYNTLIVPILLYWFSPIALITVVQYLSNGSIAVISVFSILLYGLLEEVGWRGFLRQQLKPLPAWINIFIVATLWFVWHLNFELTSANLFFFGILLLGSWGIGKVADSTQSLLAVAAFHSLNNFFMQLNGTKIAILLALLLLWVLHLINKKKQKAKIV
ncbi:CPBP family intramembrane metalloprotease [Sphingobacterium oryzagri]|uniref:CPBP family intramembrane metalloprotease n=1 Tax=Sphingobacterium oryzagri TaxID=3025669 RepID=A0ABY7WPQ2_9SPHI|nr:CPBP family intramembrane glutamic endopeptidase [Sphingobacterium sp. KACC 22765]WDF70300.1 CPBP family intramembrane metalloprotease [Sphingobacterium sp. KACC 22765]